MNEIYDGRLESSRHGPTVKYHFMGTALGETADPDWSEKGRGTGSSYKWHIMTIHTHLINGVVVVNTTIASTVGRHNCQIKMEADKKKQP